MLRTFFSCSLMLMAVLSVSGEVRLPALISDGVVLQRDTELKIWGWASPGEKVVLLFRETRYKARADDQGNWEILLPPQEPGGPYEMVFTGTNRVLVDNVLFGDVWLCAGQSNMVLPMERVKERYPDEIDGAGYPEIRHFFIPTTTALLGPGKEVPPGEWIRAVPGQVLRFSATAYFFAQSIYEKYHIPLGLINSSVGGTPIEAWISQEGLRTFPEILERVALNKNKAYVDSIMAIRPPFVRADKNSDMGFTGEVPWFDPEFEPKNWQNIHIPGYWEDQGIRELNGVVWYRREIQVPASMTGVGAKLFMGRIVDADYIYVNGTQVGNITYQYPPRRYEIPAGVLKPGRNLVVIRVINYSGKGGFVPDKPYCLTANGEVVDLKGDWQYKVGQVFDLPPGGGNVYSVQNQPTSLFNAMIAPLTRFAIRGFLWYQGESNTGNPGPYADLLKALVRDWRSQWGQGDLPFLYVQLANFMEVDYLPTESNWAELRDAQFQALSLPNTAMAVAIDLGEWNDIHPLNKKDVGKRLALGAMKLAYGEKDLVYSGPIYRSFQISGERIILTFENCGSGLVAKDGEELRRFEIAGEDGKYVWARAEIEGNRVVVWHDKVADPRSVRYAWSDNPFDANLYNREGLPASPFQTQ